MSKCFRNIAQWLRLIAEWCAPLIPEYDPQLIALMGQLISQADQLSPGTSGEYKRSWVLHQVKKQFPLRTHVLAFVLEHVLLKSRLDTGS